MIFYEISIRINRDPVLGAWQPNASSPEAVSTETSVIATVELHDGTIYTETMLASEAVAFEIKVAEMFGDDFCCCEYQFAGGACKRRRANCAQALEAFCDCAIEELEIEDIPICS